jgi:hypothetical protein
MKTSSWDGMLGHCEECSGTGKRTDCDLVDIQEAAVGDIHQSSELAAPLQPDLKPFHSLKVANFAKAVPHRTQFLSDACSCSLHPVHDSCTMMVGWTISALAQL